jgi:acyl-CoA synthetase (AMP-forming)/AMP-acid ligase II
VWVLLDRRSRFKPDTKNTESTVDSEGWVHTGDVGAIDNVGRLKVIDRVKVRHNHVHRPSTDVSASCRTS